MYIMVIGHGHHHYRYPRITIASICEYHYHCHHWVKKTSSASSPHFARVIVIVVVIINFLSIMISLVRITAIVIVSILFRTKKHCHHHQLTLCVSRETAGVVSEPSGHSLVIEVSVWTTHPTTIQHPNCFVPCTSMGSKIDQ